jgi:mono/diheme cytochrome c family protein
LKSAGKRKAMTKDRTQGDVILASTLLLALFIGLTFFVVVIVEAKAVPESVPISATFQAKCAVCHGRYGGGSGVGKSMNVPDLRSAAVQKLPDVRLAAIISEGDAGMPSFKNSLSADEIQGLVRYVRSLRRKK